MEIESLFSSTRWDIIKALSKDKLSPMELAQRLKTTSANISQQLRLLELAGLIKSEKISNVDKGKPRIIYSLIGDSAFLILATSNFAEKKLLMLTNYHKFMMRSWFIDNIEYHPVLAELYIRVSAHLDSISLIAAQAQKELVVHISTGLKAKDSLARIASDFKKAKITVHDEKYTPSKDALILYNPKGNLGEVEKNE